MSDPRGAKMLVEEAGRDPVTFSLDHSGQGLIKDGDEVRVQNKDGIEQQILFNGFFDDLSFDSDIDLGAFTLHIVPTSEVLGIQTTDIIFKQDFTGTIAVNGNSYRIEMGALQEGSREQFLEDISFFTRGTVRKVMIGERELEQAPREIWTFDDSVHHIFSQLGKESNIKPGMEREAEMLARASGFATPRNTSSFFVTIQ